MTRTLALLLGTAAIALPALSVPGTAFAQTEISDDTGTTVRTSTAGDVTVTTAGTIEPTTDAVAIVLDSVNNVEMNGTIQFEDRNDVTGIEVETGNTGDVTLGGVINLIEDFQPDDTDGDNIPDGPFAQGSGRTGILISGAATHTGTIASLAASQIRVEGNDSAGIQLASGATLAGNLDLNGGISLTGDRNVGLAVDGTVQGNVVVDGSIASQGTDSQAVRIAGDVSGRYESSATITNTGYRLATRPTERVRNLLDADDLRQAASAIQVNGNVAGGVFFRQVTTTTTADDGTETTTITARSSVTHAGNAPAILLDGNGTPIAIGVIAEITDITDPNFAPDLQYAFINQGDFEASGVYDDVNATVFEASDVSFSGGLSNTGAMRAFTFRSGDSGTEDQAGFTGAARVIVLGDNAIAERLNNSGLIAATVSEAADVIYADRNAVIPARALSAVAIDIAATAELAEITNSGSITAIVTGRNGEAVVIRDASGTLSTVNNTGIIGALGINSDTTNVSETDFNLIAIDVSNNTVGVNIVQSDNPDSVILPRISGDILLGSGDDTVTVTQGDILGNIDFGAGDDSLSVSNGTFDGELRDENGTLTLAVVNSAVTLRGGAPVNVASASFDANSSFQPTIDGVAGTASTLTASGDVSFADGATITPILSSVVGGGLTRYALATGSSLTVGGDIDSLGAGFSPFLYDTSYSVDPGSNTLFVDLRLRTTDELGLDGVQAGAFDSTIEALGANNALAAAVLNITDGSVFNTAYNQLLPEFSAAARQFVLANVDGAVGAVGSHLDTARRGQGDEDLDGGLWFQEFAYFADRDRAGLSEQYRGQGFGFTGGLDKAVGPFHAVGVNFGFASTEIEDVIGVDEPLDVVTVQLGAYAGLELGGVSFDAYGGYGIDNFESNRVVEIGDFRQEASGDWSGSHLNGSLRAGYDVALGKRFWMRPTVSLDYLSLTENDFIESGPAGVALAIDERTVDSAAVTGMLNFGAEFAGKRTWVRPALRVGYRNEFMSDDLITTGRFAGLDTPFSLTGNEFPDTGLLLGLSVAAGSGYSSFSFDLDSDIRDGFIRHTGRVVVRIMF